MDSTGSAPSVSVVVPVHNAGDLLAECLDSLLAQTHGPLKVVVVDDGSTDESGRIAARYAERHPDRIAVTSVDHGGRARARQMGVDLAEGDLVGFVDADDWAEREMYAVLSAAFRDPTVDVAVCRYRNATSQGQEPGHVYEEGSDDLYGGTLLDHPRILVDVQPSLCNKLFRRTLFSSGVGFPPDKDFEDLATTYRLLGLARRIVRVEAPPLYNYRQAGPVSVMNARDHRYADIVDAVEENCAFFRSRGEFDALEPHLLRMALRHAVFARFGSYFDVAGTDVVWPYLDRVYELLDEEFPLWRRSDVLREMCGSVFSLTLVRSKQLMKAFVAYRALLR